MQQNDTNTLITQFSTLSKCLPSLFDVLLDLDGRLSNKEHEEMATLYSLLINNMTVLQKQLQKAVVPERSQVEVGLTELMARVLSESTEGLLVNDGETMRLVSNIKYNEPHGFRVYLEDPKTGTNIVVGLDTRRMPHLDSQPRKERMKRLQTSEPI